MVISETHLQFLHLVERLKNINWDRQFVTLKPHEFCALSIIRSFRAAHPEVPGIYVSDLAAEMKMPVPAASKLIRSLESNGWVSRSVDPQNRRNTFVVLTEAGEAVQTQEIVHTAQLSDRIFERMGAENTAALLHSVNDIISILEEELNG